MGFSPISAAIKLECASKPEMPTNVDATNLEDSRIKVSWDESKSNGSPITRYNVLVKSNTQQYVNINEIC